MGAAKAAAPIRSYGFVVESVKVRTFVYAPERSASVAPIDCLKPSGTTSLETGEFQAFGTPVTCSGCGSENVPFTRWPGSETLSAASPAVETTLAVVCAV